MVTDYLLVENAPGGRCTPLRTPSVTSSLTSSALDDNERALVLGVIDAVLLKHQAKRWAS